MYVCVCVEGEVVALEPRALYTLGKWSPAKLHLQPTALEIQMLAFQNINL